MKGKLLFIFNPKSGKAQIRGKLLEILDLFVKAGYEVTVYVTQSQGDGYHFLMNKDCSFDLLVCSGGDGTLDEVATAVIQKGYKMPIGYIPAGSTNDFAKSLKISKNMITAAKDAIAGKTFACDMGLFNDDVFVYIAAFGIFTDVSYETKQEMKNMLGHMAYILEGMRRLPAVQAYSMRIQYDETVLEGEYIYGMVTNSLSVGGFKRITGKYVELDDGVFEVTLIKKPNNPLELNLIIASLLNRKINTDYMECFKTAQISFEASEPLPWTLDGEYGGNHRKVTVQNIKQAIGIRVPSDDKE